MDLETKDIIESSVSSVPILLPKRKRGRPRKVPTATDTGTIDKMLDEMRGSLGIHHLSSPHVVDVVSIDPVEDSVPPIQPEPLSDEPLTSSSPAKKGRGRPRKHPQPVPGTEPEIKRKRGRPPKTPTTPTKSVADSLLTEPESHSHPVVPTAMLVPPPELVPEPSQVSVAQITASTDSNLDKAEIPLLVVPIVLPLSTVGGIDSPSLDESIKKKRGRPRKHPPPVIDPNAVKRKRGRPKKNPSSTSPEPKKGRGRPKKNPGDFEAENQPEREWQPPEKSDGEMPEKRPRGRPRKHPKPENDEPVVKRKRGRPKKEPVAGPIPISDQIPPPKKKRGRPKKNPAAAMAVIPAQSSEPLDISLPSFPAVSISSSYPLFGADPTNLNTSSGTGKPSNEVFQQMLSCPSDSETADFATVPYTTARIQKMPRKDSPLLDDRFVESSDEED